MLKAQQHLVESDYFRQIGNHHVNVIKDRDGKVMFKSFIYFQTVICFANYKEGVFYTDNGGYATRSTTRAIRGYEDYFNEGLGYTQVTKKDFDTKYHPSCY